MVLLKQILRRIPLLSSILRYLRDRFNEWSLHRRTRRALNRSRGYAGNRIFYIGVPAHTNLGDLAQGVCIRKWLKKHYPTRTVVEIETNALVNTRRSLLNELKNTCTVGDFIVFQSGYTTTDLGGFADEMHRAVMRVLPKTPMLMLPQTVFFRSAENKARTAKSYNAIKGLLFLARDRVSFDAAKEMFPNVRVLLYPDIVTTMIGRYRFDQPRDGILFCCRNDSEKYYNDEQIGQLMARCAKLCKVEKTDTTKSGSTKEIVKNAQAYVEREISAYSRYRLIVTDRYHGTILSLVAGTPVIIIKTTDHKVITGVEWFRGVYDNMVFLAEDLEEAYDIAVRILAEEVPPALPPYFEAEYYDKLPMLWEETIGEGV